MNISTWIMVLMILVSTGLCIYLFFFEDEGGTDADEKAKLIAAPIMFGVFCLSVDGLWRAFS